MPDQEENIMELIEMHEAVAEMIEIIGHHGTFDRMSDQNQGALEALLGIVQKSECDSVHRGKILAAVEIVERCNPEYTTVMQLCARIRERFRQQEEQLGRDLRTIQYQNPYDTI
ncbi:MAG: hypothetical protein V1807_00695 [Patescibacteria group bacterium]